MKHIFAFEGASRALAVAWLVCAGLGLVAGCAKKAPSSAGRTPPPPEVGVVTVKTESVPLVTELPGRLDAYRVAEVRARATGILLKRNFEEGADVKEGEVLFRIDPAPMQANYDSANAMLARAEANLQQARSKSERFKALVGLRAVSKQDYEDATAMAAQAEAEVQAAQAAVETAKLNLGYATVTAPISGRIGAAKVTEGALVSQTEATPMATIQQLDPIYFDFTQSSKDVLRLRRELEHGQLKSLEPGAAKVTLILEDGTIYPHPGKLLFSDISVDPSTGMVGLRALFPNPEHLLLPGLFARGQLEQAVDTQAITVLQRGVTHGAGGTATALVVSTNNIVEKRTVETSVAFGDKWMVTKGLRPGDRVIVEGVQKARPGSPVKPVPFNPPAETNEVSVVSATRSGK